jgi:hypothetical protein
MHVRFKDDLPAFYAPAKPRTILEQAEVPPTSNVTPMPNDEPPAVVESTDSHQLTKKSITGPPHKLKFIRPSLSEQLASIGIQAQSLVNKLKPESSKVLMTVPTASMMVGRLECKYPSPVDFDEHVCRYHFLHASRDISMFMYYKDMCDIAFEKRTLR